MRVGVQLEHVLVPPGVGRCVLPVAGREVRLVLDGFSVASVADRDLLIEIRRNGARLVVDPELPHAGDAEEPGARFNLKKFA